MQTPEDSQDDAPRLAGGTATGLWQDLIRDAGTRAERQLDEHLESYLVFTLLRHQQDAQLGQRVMALEWLRALEQGTRLRESSLRDVGDRCLLIAGLYPEQAERRLVSLGYFTALGQNAYDHLAARLQAGMAELYARLAAAFNELVRVLLEVRRLAAAGPVLTPLQSFDLCRQQGRLSPGEASRSFPGAIVIEAPARAQ